MAILDMFIPKFMRDLAKAPSELNEAMDKFGANTDKLATTMATSLKTNNAPDADAPDQQASEALKPGGNITKIYAKDGTEIVLKNTTEQTREAREVLLNEQQKVLNANIAALDVVHGTERERLRGELAGVEADIQARENDKATAVQKSEAAAKALKEAQRVATEAEAEMQRRIEETNKEIEKSNAFRRQNDLEDLPAVTKENLRERLVSGDTSLSREERNKLALSYNAYADSQEKLDSARLASDEANQEFNSIDAGLKKIREDKMRLVGQYQDIGKQYTRALDSYHDRVAELGPGKPNEADQIQSIIDAIEAKVANKSNVDRQAVKDAMEAALLVPDRNRTASKFMDLIEGGNLKDEYGNDVKNLAELGIDTPNRIPLPDDKDSKIGVNMTIRKNDDGQYVASFKRMVSRPGDPEISDMVLNDSGVIDFGDAFKHMRVSMRVDITAADGRFHLANDDKLAALDFVGPQPGMYAQGYDSDKFANPAEIFTVAESSVRTTKSLQIAGQLADAESERQQVVMELHAARKLQANARFMQNARDEIEGKTPQYTPGGPAPVGAQQSVGNDKDKQGERFAVSEADGSKFEQEKQSTIADGKAAKNALDRRSTTNSV